jgi:hypothetical protein
MRLLAAEVAPIDVAAIDAHPIAPLPRELRDRGVEAILRVRPLAGDAVALGRFQRARSAVDVDALRARGTPVVRRAAGGPALRVGAGMLHVLLRLDAPESLGGVADVQRAANRHVRPLLRAIESLGAPATFGGRDVILVRGAPVAWIGLAHAARTRATELEAFVGVTSSFAIEPELDLAAGSIAPRFLGRAPAPLATVLGKPIDEDGFARAVVDAYAASVDVASAVTDEERVAPAERPDLDEPPFTAMVEEAIGLVGARWEPERRRVALGGDLGASEDALAALESTLFDLGRDASDEAIASAVDAHLGPASGAMTFGVKSLRSIARVAAHAMRA